MINLVFQDGTLESDSYVFCYLQLATMKLKERSLSSRTLRKMWLSGNNSAWMVYLHKWHVPHSIKTIGEDSMELTFTCTTTGVEK